MKSILMIIGFGVLVFLGVVFVVRLLEEIVDQFPDEEER